MFGARVTIPISPSRVISGVRRAIASSTLSSPMRVSRMPTASRSPTGAATTVTPSLKVQNCSGSPWKPWSTSASNSTTPMCPSRR